MTEGAVIDLDGTVYRGEELLPGADHGVEWLRSVNSNVLFVLNSPIKRRDWYCKKLNQFGITCDPVDIITSATVTADYLARHHPDSVSYVVGKNPFAMD